MWVSNLKFSLHLYNIHKEPIFSKKNYKLSQVEERKQESRVQVNNLFNAQEASHLQCSYFT